MMSNERRDLNLFRIFASVMEHRNLAMVGRELGLTASAISHALSRLRALMGDELFLAGARGMQPTPRALELAPRVASALGELYDVMARREFVPAISERIIRIGASDYSSTCLLPALVRRVIEKAPHMRLRVMPIGRIDLIEQLDVAQLDLVLSWFGDVPDRIRRKPLVVEHEAIVVRRDHPLVSGKPDLVALLSFPHLVVEFTGADDFGVDGFVNERGLYRRVWVDRLLLDNVTPERMQKLATVTVPTFAPVPSMLAATDLVATLPLRLAQLVMQHGDFVTLDLPYEPKQVTVEAAWHERGDLDGALQWIIAELVAALQAA